MGFEDIAAPLCLLGAVAFILFAAVGPKGITYREFLEKLAARLENAGKKMRRKGGHHV